MPVHQQPPNFPGATTHAFCVMPAVSDDGSRVAPDDYQDDFAFTGTLKRVTFDLSGDLIVDSDTDMKVAMAPMRFPT